MTFKEVTLVSRTQPSGPLCLWQCFLYIYFFIIAITIVPWGSGLLGGLGLLIKDQDFVKPLVLSYSAKPMSSTAVP